MVTTTTVAMVLGLGAGMLVQPGRFVPRPEQTADVDLATTSAPTLSDLPDNPLGSMVEGQMLQVVIFSLLVGIALLSIRLTGSGTSGSRPSTRASMSRWGSTRPAGSTEAPWPGRSGARMRRQ